MAPEQSIWFRVGYALERARGREPAAESEDAPRKSTTRSPSRDPAGPWPSADDLVATGLTALLGRVLGAWAPARRVTFTRLLRAGLAGAGAALLIDLVRPLIRGRVEAADIDRDTGVKMLSGAGQGLVYGAVVEPRVPGPPLVKGAVFALAEYMAHPAGGLSHLLGPYTPQGRLPMVSDLLADLEPREREYLEHLAFGVALAVLCGAGPSVNGSGGADD